MREQRQFEHGKWRVTDQGHSGWWMVGYLWPDDPDGPDGPAAWDDSAIPGNSLDDLRDLAVLLSEVTSPHGGPSR